MSNWLFCLRPAIQRLILILKSHLIVLHVPKDTIIHVHITLTLQFKVSAFHSWWHVLLMLLLSGFCVAIKVAVLGMWAVWSDGTAEVVNNLLRHTALRRVTNVCQRNGPREVRAGLLTSAPPQPLHTDRAGWRRPQWNTQFDGRCLFLCPPTLIKTYRLSKIHLPLQSCQ